MDRSVLEGKALAELRQIASTLQLSGYQKLKKADLIDLIAGGSSNGKADEANGDDDGHDDDGHDDDGRDEDARDDDGRDEDGRDHESSNEGRTRARHRDGGDNGGGDGEGGRSGRTRTRERDDDDDDSDDDRGPDDFDDGQRRRNKRNRNRNKGGTAQGGQGGQAGQGGDNLDDLEVREGVLDLLPEGYGFLRTTGYTAGERDVYVSQSFVRRHGLRRGDLVKGPVRHNRGNDKFPALARIDTVEGEPLRDGQVGKRVDFKDLTPLFPNERLRLETDDGDAPVAMRVVDMLAPIGLGQRGLIVSPPKAGKTTVLKQLAHAIETNNPDVHLMVVLVDERPEEVTDFTRSTGGEVIASTFDRPAEDHTQVAEIAIERAKRLVERGRDVVILLDSITRLGRAYNLAAPASGRILSGGIDSAALYPPKRFFGAARNIEDGGSLTILATALIDTGSKMDEVIFEEFKGTGNMELRLDRKMEQKRIFPAIDVQQSGTRREELLLAEDEIDVIWKLRRVLSQMDSGAALELLIDKLKNTKTNKQFLSMIAKSNLS